jgi:hypothetical protein
LSGGAENLACMAITSTAASHTLGHGIHAPASEDPHTALLLTLDAWRRVLPASAVFTGLTAAAVYGLWLPPIPALVPIFVDMGTCRGEVKPSRPELRVTRHPTRPTRVLLGEIPLAAAPEALLACGRLLGLLDLIILVDAALRRRRCTRAAIVEVAHRRRRGAPLLRQALSCADGRSESPWESVLRLFHVAVGVTVLPQAVLRDAQGAFVARADLLVAGTATLHEYDGAGHRDAATHREDLRRDRRLTSSGYVRRGYTSEDLRLRAAEMLRDCDSALGRPHRPSRLEAWDALIADSLYFGQMTPRLATALRPRSPRKLVSYPADSGE